MQRAFLVPGNQQNNRLFNALLAVSAILTVYPLTYVSAIKETK
jgi:hypothetical protein